MSLCELAAGVFITTSRRYSLNSVIVTAGPADGRVLLVDPGWDEDELEAIAADMALGGMHPVAGFATHAHYDHLLWHPLFGSVPRWASTVSTGLAEEHRSELLADLGAEYSSAVIDLFGRVQALHRDTLPWAGRDVEIVVHNAHVAGHTALWLPDCRVLIAGDMLSDIELPLLDHVGDDPSGGLSSLQRYRDGLDALAEWAAAASWVIPGHGSPGRHALARVDADRRYLDALESGQPPVDQRTALPGMADVHRSQAQLMDRDRH